MHSHAAASIVFFILFFVFFIAILLLSTLGLHGPRTMRLAKQCAASSRQPLHTLLGAISQRFSHPAPRKQILLCSLPLVSDAAARFCPALGDPRSALMNSFIFVL